jgi:lysophospholipase L1-like esterase
MNTARLAIAVLAIGALVAAASYWRKGAVADSHRQARELVLRYTLARFDQPIVILGDSITEASTLPRSLCDHPVVNAGLNSASSYSDLGTWLLEALDGKRAAAILVALGTNDALVGHSTQVFETNITSLLAKLAGAADRLAVLGIPSIEGGGNVKAELQKETMGRIETFNAMLPALASKGGATFVALPAMPEPHTIDGVHLDAAGYAVWDAAVLKAMSGACSQ